MIIRSRRVVLPGGVRAATVHVDGERIVRVADWDDIYGGAHVDDAGDSVVMPGIVDTHVHANEPGRTEWEGFETITRAAAAGGVTSILDMPLNSIPATTTVDALRVKREAASGKSHVNVEFIGGVVPGNTGELEGLADAGVRAFKCFLTPSGVDEFANVTEAHLVEAFPVLERIGLPLMVHAEDPGFLRPAKSSTRYTDYLASRPVEAERSAISLLISLMKRWPVPVHIVHLSSAKSLDLIRDAKAAGLPLTVETCPHYLTFTSEQIPEGRTEYKCAPPIREATERDGLWDGLIRGDIDLVASDHSPCPPQMKETDGDFASAWGGIASLQLSLSAVWTGARSRRVAPELLAQWMSRTPAKLAGLDNRKGVIATGYDADIVVWNPESKFLVETAKLEHRHHISPYAGMQLFGVVEGTYVAGDRLHPSNRKSLRL